MPGITLPRRRRTDYDEDSSDGAVSSASHGSKRRKLTSEIPSDVGYCAFPNDAIGVLQLKTNRLLGFRR